MTKRLVFTVTFDAGRQYREDGWNGRWKTRGIYMDFMNNTTRAMLEIFLAIMCDLQELWSAQREYGIICKNIWSMYGLSYNFIIVYQISPKMKKRLRQRGWDETSVGRFIVALCHISFSTIRSLASSFSSKRMSFTSLYLHHIRQITNIRVCYWSIALAFILEYKVLVQSIQQLSILRL